MNYDNLFTSEQIKAASELSGKAQDFLMSDTASGYFAQKISDSVGTNPEKLITGIQSTRVDSSRFTD